MWSGRCFSFPWDFKITIRMETLFSQVFVLCLQDKKVGKVQLKLLHPGKCPVKFSFYKRVELSYKLDLEILNNKEAENFDIYYKRKTISLP